MGHCWMSKDCAHMTAPLVWGWVGPKNVFSLGLSKTIEKIAAFSIFSQNWICNVSKIKWQFSIRKTLTPSVMHLQKEQWWARWNKWMWCLRCGYFSLMRLVRLIGSSIWTEASRVQRESWLPPHHPSLSWLFFCPICEGFGFDQGVPKIGANQHVLGQQKVCVSLYFCVLVHRR